MSQPTLNYLFEADLSNGTTYHQGRQDISLVDPARSAFYDVAQRLDEVIRFHLVGDLNRYSVDLLDGHFEVNGVSFEIHDQFLEPKDLRLIYFRETRVELRLGPGGKRIPGPHYVNRYFIGWQTTYKGKNIQHTLAIS